MGTICTGVAQPGAESNSEPVTACESAAVGEYVPTIRAAVTPARRAHSSAESKVAMPRKEKNPVTSVIVVSTIDEDCAGS